MSVPTQCDVVVVGGGPAGSTAAALLARRGYSVVLLEKERHPRYSVGESVIPHFWRYADASGASEKIAAEGFVEKAGGTVEWNNVIRQLRFKDFGYTRPALHVERDRFDALLLSHAEASGVGVHQQVAVDDVLLDERESTVAHRSLADGATGRTACRFVVDASGQSAVVARKLGLRVVDEGFRFLSLWGYFEGGRYVDLDGKARPVADMGRTPPTTFISSIANTNGCGWAWHIPLRKQTSVGLVLPRDDFRSERGGDAPSTSLDEMFLRACERVDSFRVLLETARFIEGSVRVIRDYSYRPTELAGPGFFLVGDAGAFTDPIFSIGVVFAMYSAFVASWAVHGSMRNRAGAAQYRGIFADQLRSRIEVGRSVALPRTGIGPDNRVETDAIALESAMEQDLLHTIAVLTTRSDNFVELARGTNDGSHAKYHTLGAITVA